MWRRLALQGYSAATDKAKEEAKKKKAEGAEGLGDTGVTGFC
jgi:hypothetical protein